NGDRAEDWIVARLFGFLFFELAFAIEFAIGASAEIGIGVAEFAIVEVLLPGAFEHLLEDVGNGREVGWLGASGRCQRCRCQDRDALPVASHWLIAVLD